jgi:EAL domain-containing protein (putative c-di-GMP-specific phosphodiesterase class I)
VVSGEYFNMMFGNIDRLEFDVYAQGIHSRNCFNKSRVEKNSVNGIELLLRPKGVNTDIFYNSISFNERIFIGSRLISWLYNNCLELKGEFKGISFITINLEVNSISLLKDDLIVLSDKLNYYSIDLMVEVTERNRFFSKENLMVIYNLYDVGIKFAIDDMDVTEYNLSIFNLNVFDYIKIKISDYFSIPNRKDFLDRMLSQKKEIIVENVETLFEIKRLKIEPVSLFQGYFLCYPRKIDNVILG